MAFGWDGGLPHYSTDAAADYEVLRHVRENWSPAAFAKFADCLWAIRCNRHTAKVETIVAVPALAEVGDYALASLLALCG